MIYFFSARVTRLGCEGGYASMLAQLGVNETKTQRVPLLIPDGFCGLDCQKIAQMNFGFSYQITTTTRANELLKGSSGLDFLSEEYPMKDTLGQPLVVHIQDIVYPPNPTCHNLNPKKFSESDCWKIAPPQLHYRILRGFNRPSLLNFSSSRCMIP